MKAVVADPIGGPENLRYVTVPDPEPKAGEVLVKLEAIGVNYTDVYFRTGLYKAAETPVRLGNEGAGTVVSAGEGSRFKAGDRVAYAMVRGSYAEQATVPETMLVALPAGVSMQQGAAVLLQGMTAHYLTRSTYPLKAGESCVVHAAAGGTGLLLVQLAKLAGAAVIGLVSTEEKAALAKEQGADYVLQYGQHEDFAHEVKRLTGGRGVDVVYDSVGADTFMRSLDCLRARGMMVTFGQSSGAVGAIDPLLLLQKGSLYLTRPTLANYVSSEELEGRCNELFGWLAAGQLTVRIHKVYPLAEAAEAHRELESRRSTGKLLLEA